MNHRKYQRELIMRENKNNPELKIRSTERDYKYISRITDRYAGLSLVFLTAGIVLWTVMHVIFDVCIDSWMADPKLLNFQYMWNVLMKVMPFTLWALAVGFLVTAFLSPLYELINGNIMIFLLKRRMRRENKLREGKNDATH
ncbi:conjugal transfer protein TrbF [Salmonella enterica subsp. enterica serovar Give]|uniref:F-type conjugal transfer protein TrbF n=2 Tax=Salmonella enterica TaxID=28901 RepID=A0A8E7KD61_SALET|nr:conjugal transfer protein TrbF [Salmonella enterica]EBL6585307.1 conjugal transfer protein TrbF [Salmonella enterica subsp. enterica serovar Give]EBW2289665.1 conjugal transfer protein TrbF [Salmonella enterica subsp. enterica serovar Newport]EDU9351089.1 F-type conjugal transfer protein TrbF [Salmonella enterica subsp. enterica]EEP8237647.1 F-type conjugal transfer protein TrbF [Salmonella enterica subsp. enterica serovar Chester]